MWNLKKIYIFEALSGPRERKYIFKDFQDRQTCNFKECFFKNQKRELKKKTFSRAFLFQTRGLKKNIKDHKRGQEYNLYI